MKLIFNSKDVEKLKETKQEPIKEKSLILNYFSSVSPKAYSGSKVVDAITGEKTDIFNNMFSDNEFTWTSVTVFLFKKYNLQLNEDFIQHVLSRS